MDKDVHMLAECTNYNELSFVRIELKSIVCHPYIDFTATVT